MEKLPENFSLKKYGLKARLVNEDDASFILSLRANPNRTRYMITLDNNIECQIKWIKEYKKREQEGLDYYFIYYNDKEEPIGLNRVSHVDFKTKTAKISSLIVVKGLKYEVLKMMIIRFELAFDSLGISTVWGDVHKENTRAIKILELFGFKFKDNGTDYLDVFLEKNDFFEACKNSVIYKLRNK